MSQNVCDTMGASQTKIKQEPTEEEFQAPEEERIIHLSGGYSTPCGETRTQTIAKQEPVAEEEEEDDMHLPERSSASEGTTAVIQTLIKQEPLSDDEEIMDASQCNQSYTSIGTSTNHVDGDGDGELQMQTIIKQEPSFNDEDVIGPSQGNPTYGGNINSNQTADSAADDMLQEQEHIHQETLPYTDESVDPSQGGSTSVVSDNSNRAAGTATEGVHQKQRKRRKQKPLYDHVEVMNSSKGRSTHKSINMCTNQTADAAAEDVLQNLCAIDVNALASEDLKEKITKMQALCKVRVQCPKGYDQEVFDSLPKEMQDELLKTNPAAMKKAERKCRQSKTEMARIKDHLGGGLHNHAPNSVSLGCHMSESASSQAVADKGRWAKASSSAQHVVTRDLSDATRDDVYNKPIHYSTVPQRVLTVANDLKSNILRRHQNNMGKPKSVEMLLNAYEVQKGSGYFKAHVNNDVSRQLKSFDILPGCFQIKENASQKSIIFFNNKDGICDCHFDRDSSILYLVSGYKEVKIAPPMNTADRPADGILHEVDPFSLNEDFHGGMAWKTIHMVPGSALFLPKFWLHCVRSIGNPNTLALSFQVELKESETGNNMASNKPMTADQYLEPVSIDAASSFSIHPVNDHSKPQKILNPPQSKKRKIKPDDNMKVLTNESTTNKISQTQTQPKSEFSFPYRRSGRTRAKCGFCSRGFNEEEMWVLQLRCWRANLPRCPIDFPKHLLCMKCCPRHLLAKSGDPGQIIKFSDGKQRPILTKEEFCDLQYYEYVSASYIDYTSKFVNQGQALFGQAGGECPADLNEKTMIKSEI